MSKRREPAVPPAEKRLASTVTASGSESESVVFLVRSDVKKELEKGKRKFEQGDAEGARLAYERALDLDPSCAIAYFYLGFTHHEMGDLELAKESYLHAIDLDRKQTLFLEHLARLHFELNEYSVCLVRFQEAQTLGPLQPISYGLMGRAFYELDRYTEAVDCLERMLEGEEDPRLRSIARYYLVLSHLGDHSTIAVRQEALRLLNEETVDPMVCSGLADRFRALCCFSLAHEFILALESDTEGFAERLEELDRLIEEAEAPLSRLFTSDEEKLLHHLHLVSQCGTDKIYRVMLSLLESPSPLVREAVLNYCRRFGYPVSRAIVAECLEGETIVQESALLYAAGTFQKDYLDLMVASLDHPSKEVRVAVYRYLERRGNLTHLAHLDAQMENAVGASLRRQIQRTINQIKRRHTDQTDKLAAAPVHLAPPSKPRESRPLGKILTWAPIALAAIYVTLRLLLLFV